MGQKVNPVSFRVGVTRSWKSRWFAENEEYKKLLLEDIELREALEERLKLAGVHDIEIERLPRAIKIKLQVSRPGIVIGRGGSGIEEVRNFVLEKMGYKPGDPKAPRIEIPVDEVKNYELSAKLVAARIIGELERRMPHRRVVAKTMDRVMAAGAKGIKIVLSGRIGGAEISRREKYHRGSVPTQSLRSTIDYHQSPALLRAGYVGIKVWIHKEEEESNSL
ncbi:30S ribosomal protein S3 [Candidatus Woesebacteria bacterium]|nr:30S ribosomal protein S3 [Candidatus Woesebacteria bacterium]